MNLIGNQKRFDDMAIGELEARVECVSIWIEGYKYITRSSSRVVEREG